MRFAIAGRVVALWRYPVKSMAGEELQEIEVSWHGFTGDRRWAFVRAGQERNGFPWLTLRERPELVRYRPRVAGAGAIVRMPDGAELDIADPALAAALGEGVRVMKQDRGIFDTLPLSLITTQTIASLGARVERPLDVRRFRPNLVIAATGRAAYPEDRWLGATLRIGSARMHVDKRDERCMIVNIDPETLRRDAATLRAIAQHRDASLGVYGSTVEPGRIAVGDPVFVEPAPARRRRTEE